MVTTSMPESGHMQVAMVSPCDGPSGIVTLFSREAPGFAPTAAEISSGVSRVQARTCGFGAARPCGLGAACVAATARRRAALRAVSAVKYFSMELLLRSLNAGSLIKRGYSTLGQRYRDSFNSIPPVF